MSKDWAEGGLKGEVKGNSVVFTFPDGDSALDFSDWVFDNAVKRRNRLCRRR